MLLWILDSLTSMALHQMHHFHWDYHLQLRRVWQHSLISWSPCPIYSLLALVLGWCLPWPNSVQMRLMCDYNHSTCVYNGVYYFQIYLGGYPNYWIQQEAEAATENFVNEMKDLDEQLTKRNKTLEMPYPYLMPGMIPTVSLFDTNIVLTQ